MNPAWVIATPLLAAAFVAAEHYHLLGSPGLLIQIPAVVLLIGTVFSAVHHAEVVALRIGEPIGSLVLAASVTVIEVALIITIMMASSESGDDVARDTVFAAVMIVLTGIIGVCLLAGGIRHHEQGFQVSGATGALSVLATLATLTLILPNFTVAVPGPYYSQGQLIGVAAVSTALYFHFLFVQSVRHRDYFLDHEEAGGEGPAKPSAAGTATSLMLLLVALAAVVLIAEGLSPAVESVVFHAGLPASFVGVVIASVILLPESIAAFRAARANRLQKSLNLALGSALASIGLTIPAVALCSILLGVPLGLGLEPEHTALLVLALFVSMLTLATGRTTVLQGGVHLVIFATFLIISAVP